MASWKEGTFKISYKGDIISHHIEGIHEFSFLASFYGRYATTNCNFRPNHPLRKGTEGNNSLPLNLPKENKFIFGITALSWDDSLRHAKT